MTRKEGPKSGLGLMTATEQLGWLTDHFSVSVGAESFLKSVAVGCVHPGVSLDRSRGEAPKQASLFLLIKLGSLLCLPPHSPPDAGPEEFLCVLT